MEQPHTMRVKFFFVLYFVFCLAASIAGATTWNVKPDGSGDALTIQAGLDSSAAGDTVLVECGTYYESGLHGMKPGALIASETGEYSCATIDAQREWSVFTCWDSDSTTIIKGFTITRGYSSEDEGPPGAGGGMKCQSSVRVVNCLFLDNLTYGYGGAVWVDTGTPRFENCVFVDNSAAQGGAIYISHMAGCIIKDCTFVGNYSTGPGTVYCNGSSPRIQGCTFYGNAAEGGGSGISILDFASPQIDNTIIAYGTPGGAVRCDEWSHPAFTCCDIYGNADGDWDEYTSTQNGVNGNFSSDPKFCDASNGDFTLEACSPSLPGNHPDGYECGEVIGAFGQGCECDAVTGPATWGSIKATYR